MAKQSNYILLGLLLIVVSFFVFSKVKEGFYSTTGISGAKNKVDTIIRDNLSKMVGIISDINANKYSIDVTSAISDLNRDMEDNKSKMKQTTYNYIKSRKTQLSNAQSNLNKINKAMSAFAGNTMIEQIVNIDDDTSIQKIPIIDAVNRVNEALKKISTDLSEIPDN